MGGRNSTLNLGFALRAFGDLDEGFGSGLVALRLLFGG